MTAVGIRAITENIVALDLYIGYSLREDLSASGSLSRTTATAAGATVITVGLPSRGCPQRCMKSCEPNMHCGLQQGNCNSNMHGAADRQLA